MSCSVSDESSHVIRAANVHPKPVYVDMLDVCAVFDSAGESSLGERSPLVTGLRAGRWKGKRGTPAAPDDLAGTTRHPEGHLRGPHSVAVVTTR